MSCRFPSFPGSIPAGAGKPGPVIDDQALAGVHPRGRGEAASFIQAGDYFGGPSPRARGSHGGTEGSERERGSIPAGAGKPPARCCSASRVTGPSPRARGSRRRACIARSSERSIPAGAGKPTRSTPETLPLRVHPRGRGEAAPSTGHSSTVAGPSPRARGSQDEIAPHVVRDGSIPAGAGKPLSNC